MVLLNFSFTEMQVKRNKTSEKVTVKSGMNIESLTPTDAIKQPNQRAFIIGFSYAVDYEPKAGHIKIFGEVTYLADNDLADQIEATWKEQQNLPKDLGLHIYNRILHHCSIEALLLSKEIGLPAPIQLPKIQVKPVLKKNAEQKTDEPKTAEKNTPQK